MTNRLSTIIISLIMIATSLTLLLIFFTFNKTEKTILERLTLRADNLSLTVGETVTNFYDVSSENAVVTFDIENPSIISINGKNLFALDVGKTNIKITASLNDVTTETNMTVEITNESFVLQLAPSQNCYFDDNILYLTGDFCRFTVNIIDYDGNLIKDFYYLSTGSSTLNKEFLYFELQSTQDCQIIFYIPAENTQLKLNVVHL